jgi:hypothetical protein
MKFQVPRIFKGPNSQFTSTLKFQVPRIFKRPHSKPFVGVCITAIALVLLACACGYFGILGRFDALVEQDPNQRTAGAL